MNALVVLNVHSTTAFEEIVNVINQDRHVSYQCVCVSFLFVDPLSTFSHQLLNSSASFSHVFSTIFESNVSQ